MTGIGPAPGDDDRTAELEALMKEARERQRRRRLRLVLVAGALLVAAGVSYWIVRASSGGARIEHAPNGPVVNVSAFAHHGRLAFVSRGVLWALDGQNNTLRRITTPAGARPTEPTFSPDGKWLAYLAQRIDPDNHDQRNQLWIARSDGTDGHAVPGFLAYGIYGWSPTSDVLAVSTGPTHSKQPCPCGTPRTLRLVSPDGSSRILASGPWIYSAAWAPDGHALAVGIEGDPAVGEPSSIASYPINGGKPTTWLRVRPRQRLQGMTGVLLEPAGWWHGFGIGFWIYGNGATRNLDATPLDLIAKPGAEPRLLDLTLSDGMTSVIAASTRGARLAIVADISEGVNGGRVFWDKKQVQVCNRKSGCRGLLKRSSKVSVDPVWSPDGETLAFIEAPDYVSAGWSQSSVRRWYGAHQLLLYDVGTGELRAVPAAKGATVPIWSRSSQSLLYVADDGLWLLPTLTGKPVEIATPLFPPSNWPSYFAQVAWNAQFAWWSGS
jgi:dipeptidyl aminopeptidase/acylaminoacyl peptidase